MTGHGSQERRTAVVGEIDVAASVSAARISALVHEGGWCFEAHRVCCVERFFARDRARAVLVFLAPDAESVRLACRCAGLDLTRVWACDEPKI